ncbi:MAG TPA: vitamin K epoxide reductase family protein [Vicinamibacterales bacterium]|nr:vitamin K epoxide reductase family protein [Vicinamibacterales bacterium]
MLLIVWLSLFGGLAASIAALYGYYRVLPGWLTGPEICRLEAGGCAVLFRSPRAALLGVPNASLGIVLYGLLAAGLLLGWPTRLLFLMTVPAVAMSAFLGWSLIVNRRQCRICWAGHVSNAMLCAALGTRAVGL